MIRHFFLSTLRQIIRKPGFYLLNIFGLSVGVAAFVLMFEYATYEMSFDDFHEQAEDIYRVNFKYSPGNRLPYEGAAVFAGVGPAMEDEFPAVVETTRLVSIWGGGGILRVGDQKYRAEEIQYAESSLFRVLSLEVIEGEASTALDHIHTAMLSESMSARIFGTKSGLGKTIEVLTHDGLQNYLISGVYRVPENSHYTSDLLLSFPSLEQIVGQKLDAQWTWFDYITYIKLQKGTRPETIEERLPAMIDKYSTGPNRNSQTMAFELLPLTNIHLHSHINQEIRANGNYQTVLFLWIISMLVLSIAWINYINLYTAQATERGKEVGIRKTLGSGKRRLALQFICEAFLVNFISVLLALLLVYLCIPVLESHLSLNWPTDLWFCPQFWLRLIAIWCLGSMASGVYPALLISAFEPLKALKSTTMHSSGKTRRILVVWQFMASAALLIGASTVFHQFRQMNAQDTGINTESVMVVNAPQFRGDAHQYYQSLQQLKNNFLSYPGVSQVAVSSDVPGKVVGWRGSSRLIGSAEQERGGLIYKMVIDTDYLNLYDIPLVAGRGFERSSDSLSVLLNEKALSLYQFENAETALGKRIFFTGVDTLTVVGVVKDHYQESLRESIRPTAFLQLEEELMYLFVRLPESEVEAFTRQAEGVFQDAFPELTFDWQMLETQMEGRHATEHSFLKAFNLFVLLSLIISSLGLVGLAAFLARKRQKEMGIRKVLGSSNRAVLFLFLKDFIRLAIIGNLIVAPIAYYFSNQWLDQFAFRTNFLWWLPIVAFIITAMLAFGVTLIHLLKAARLNPSTVLSHE